jgi:hypothetical protein
MPERMTIFSLGFVFMLIKPSFSGSSPRRSLFLQERSPKYSHSIPRFATSFKLCQRVAYASIDAPPPMKMGDPLMILGDLCGLGALVVSF